MPIKAAQHRTTRVISSPRMRSLRALAIIAFGLLRCTGGGSPVDAASDATAFDAPQEVSDEPSDATSPIDGANDAANDSTPTDTTPDLDGAGGDVSDASFPSDASACSILGTYRATLGGMTIYFRFGPAGQYVAAMSITGLDTAPFNMGMYAYDALTSTLTFMQDTFCPTDVGSYRLSFSSDCNTLTFTLISDACPDRGAQSGGLVATRVP